MRQLYDFVFLFVLFFSKGGSATDFPIRKETTDY